MHHTASFFYSHFVIKQVNKSTQKTDATKNSSEELAPAGLPIICINAWGDVT